MAAPKKAPPSSDPLFEIETYKGCSIYRDREGNRDAIIVSGVKGEQLDLVFERRLDGWRPEVTVTARIGGQATPRHRRIHQSDDITEQTRKFWAALEQLAYDQVMEQQDKDQEWLHNLIRQGGTS